jgi:hypothetical protein
MRRAEVAADRTSELLQELRVAVEEALAPRGFVRAAPTHQQDGVTFDEWKRDAGWKVDMVALSYRGPSPIAVAVNVYVSIPAARPGRSAVDIDGLTVGFLAGHEPSYDLPRGLFRGAKERRFVETIASDTVAALTWFDQYATPEKCLARLDSEDRNGPRKGSPAHDAVVAYLRARVRGEGTPA